MTGPIRADELFKAWSSQQWKPIYLFAGQEDLLIDQAIQQASVHWLEKDTSGLNMDRLDAEKIEAGALVQTAQTMPFLGSTRVIRVDQASEFSAADQKLIVEALTPLPSEVRIMFVWGREWRREDAKKPLVDWVNRLGQSVIFWNLFPEQAQRWALERATRHYKKNLSARAAAWLVQHATEGLRFIDQELAKVSSYVAGRPEIDLEDIQASFGYSRMASPFEWLNAIRRRDPRSALSILERLLEEGEEPIRLLALLSRTLRDYLASLSLGEPAATLGLRFHVKRGEEGRFAQELQRWTETELITCIRQCVETEQAIKTGQETPGVGITLLTVSLTKSEELLQTANFLR